MYSTLQPSFVEELAVHAVWSSSSSPPSSPCSFDVDSSPPSSPSTFPQEQDRNDVEGTRTRKRPMDDETPKGNKRSRDWHAVDNESGDDGGDASERSPAHPYSASTTSNSQGTVYPSPPRYEKGGEGARYKRHNPRLSWDANLEDGANKLIVRSPFDTFGTGKGRLAHYGGDDYLEDNLQIRDVSQSDDEDILWHDVLAQAVDGAECSIDLSGRCLTKIPPEIGDLAKLVIIPDEPSGGTEGPYARTNSCSKRALSRSSTSFVFGAGRLGQRRGEIHLTLANNSISSLPTELFNLSGLVSLSLRANNLTELPYQIGDLRNLRELNVANNNLEYLPSELLNLKLTFLSVDLNPFLECPPTKDGTDSQPAVQIERLSAVLPLTELALRVLLSPAINSPKGHLLQDQLTVLEEKYELPIETDSLSPFWREVLGVCVPGSVKAPQYYTTPSLSPITSIPPQLPVHSHVQPLLRVPARSICPSPRHLIVNQSGIHRRPLFLHHAEECFTWEREIAGQKVGGENGIPIKWRGCNPGCLAFLDKSSVSEHVDATEGAEDWSLGSGEIVMQSLKDPERPTPTFNGAEFSNEGFEFGDEE